MRHLLLLLIVLLSGSALDAVPTPFQILGPVKEIPPQCADPTYACQDLENARECDVVKSCINDIWATMSAPEDNDDICSLCKEMVKEARDQLLSNMTQEEIKEVFEGSCKLIPIEILAEGCVKVVDDFIPQLVEMLASRMDPNMVCTVCGLCNSAHLPIEEHLRNLLNLAIVTVNSNRCDQCTNTVTQLKLFAASMSEDEFDQAFMKLCKKEMSVPVLCFDEMGSKIYQVITTSDPKTLCTVAAVCPSTNQIIKVPLQNKNVNDELVCEFCTNVLEHVKEEIIANTTVEEFRTALLNFCNHTGRLSKECTSLVNDYYDMLFDYIRKLDTKELCTLIKLCDNGMHRNKISPLVKLFPAETLPKHTKMVRLTPPLPAKKNIYSQPLVKLVPAKEMSKKDFRNAADIETNDIFGNVADFQLPTDRLAVPSINLNYDLDCPFCKAVAFFLEKDLGNDRSRDSVRRAMDNVCAKWVQEYPEQCGSFLEKYSDHVAHHIIENGDFGVLCTHIKACQLQEKDTGVNVRVISPSPAPTSAICDLCKKIFDGAENLVNNSDLQKCVKGFLEKGCQICPKKQDCIDVIDQNFDKLMAIIVKNLQSSVACPALHLCPAGSKGNLSAAAYVSVGTIECDFCKTLMQKLSNMMQDPETKSAMKSGIEKVCDLMPQEMFAECKTFFDEHWDDMMQIMIAAMNPDIICPSLSICPDSEKFNKPPKSNDLECVMCKEMMEKFEDRIKENKTKEAIKEKLEKMCSHLSDPFRDECKTLIDNYINSLVNYIIEKLDPKTMCVLLNLCPNSEKFIKPPQQNDMKCELCKEVLTKLKDLVKDKKSEEEIKSALEEVCSYLPSSWTKSCDEFVAQYTDTIIELIMQEMDIDEICSYLELCPKSKMQPPPKSSLDCDLCKKIVEIVVAKLEDKRTEDDIRDALNKVCSLLPKSMSTRCVTFVNAYMELIVSILMKEMDPTMVCAALKVCPEKDFECESCQYALHFIQTQLADNETQNEVKNVLKQFCRMFPEKLADNCDAFVDEYGAALCMLLAQEMDPSTLCPKMGFCPSTKKHLQKVVQKTNIKTIVFDECMVCTTVVDYIDKLLEDDDVDKEITALIEKACQIVPASVKDKCCAVIETYGPYILQMIGQLADSKQVCQDIDLCSRPPGHVHLLGEEKCTFGPSYWCKSKAHAAACKAEMYCAQKVWKN